MPSRPSPEMSSTRPPPSVRILPTRLKAHLSFVKKIHVSYRKYSLTKIRKQTNKNHLCSLAISTPLSHPTPAVPVHLLKFTRFIPPPTPLGPAVHWPCHLDNGLPPLEFSLPPKSKAMVGCFKSGLASPLPLCIVGKIDANNCISLLADSSLNSGLCVGLLGPQSCPRARVPPRSLLEDSAPANLQHLLPSPSTRNLASYFLEKPANKRECPHLSHPHPWWPGHPFAVMNCSCS